MSASVRADKADKPGMASSRPIESADQAALDNSTAIGGLFAFIGANKQAVAPISGRGRGKATVESEGVAARGDGSATTHADPFCGHAA